MPGWPVPPVLVRSRRCPGTPPRPHGSINKDDTGNKNEKEEVVTRHYPRM